MATLLQDLRYGLRMLAKKPGFTTVAVLALGLGIGANVAIFTLINAALLRPLPGVRDPGQLVQFERIQAGNLLGDLGYPDYLDYRERSQSFSGLAAYSGTPVSFSSGNTSERLAAQLVSGNYFEVLGVRPVIGRLLAPDDERSPGSTPPLVLSFDLWRRWFGSDPGVLGRAVQVNGHGFIVVGVAAEAFHGTHVGSLIDLWIPVTTLPVAMPRMSPGTLQDRASGWLNLFGRLRTGVGLKQAQAEISTLANDLAEAYPITNQHRSVRLVPGLGLWSDDRASLAHFFGLLLGSVGLVLLIACANVGSLLVARGESRRREIAVRLAIGASRPRLVRQLLTEGLLLSFVAGALGLLLASPAARFMASIERSGYGLQHLDLTLDSTVLAFALAVAVLAAVLSSLAPALRASKTVLASSLKEATRSTSAGRSRLQGALVIAQVALSLALLAAAGLIVRTLQNALGMDPGFQAKNTLLFSVDLSIQGYSETQGRLLYARLLRQLEGIPGVTSVSMAGTVPPDEISGRRSIFYRGEVPPQSVLHGREFELGIRVDSDTVGPNFFRTLGIPLVRGRDFTEQDTERSQPVAVINERLARRLWPSEDAIGKYIEAPNFDGPQPPPVEVIGVTQDTKYRSLLVEPPLLLYLPVTQYYNGRTRVMVRTNTDVWSLLPEIRRRIAALDKNLPIFGVKTMTEHVSDSLWQQYVALDLLGLFSQLGLFLAGVGLYGALAHSVAQRTHEIGIRMALGAERQDVLKLVVRQGMHLTLTGVIAGVVVALGLTRAISSLLYGVHSVFPTLILASCLLAVVALAASYIPARRAAKVDPIVALRYE